jgi:hypothetical protein
VRRGAPIKAVQKSPRETLGMRCLLGVCRGKRASQTLLRFGLLDFWNSFLVANRRKGFQRLEPGAQPRRRRRAGARDWFNCQRTDELNLAERAAHCHHCFWPLCSRHTPYACYSSTYQLSDRYERPSASCALAVCSRACICRTARLSLLVRFPSTCKRADLLGHQAELLD